MQKHDSHLRAFGLVASCDKSAIAPDGNFGRQTFILSNVVYIINILPHNDLTRVAM